MLQSEKIDDDNMEVLTAICLHVYFVHILLHPRLSHLLF